jgi:mono/diheme cytochrome c family protein
MMRRTKRDRVGVLACGVALALAGACTARGPAARPPAATVQAESVARGSVVYTAYCGGCHGPRGHGDGPVAGVIKLRPADLRAPDVLDGASDAEIVARLMHGTPLTVRPRANAVAEDLQVDAIVAYLPTLSRADWPQLRVGRFAYEGTCAFCHGVYGSGVGTLGARNDPPPPSLLEARNHYTDASLRSVIVDGHESMPSLAAALDPGEVTAVIAYVRHLSKGYRLYDTYCASCHGDDGRGVHPEDLLTPSLVAPTIGAETVARLGPKTTRARAMHMLRRELGNMPHFRETLTEDQLRDVIAYLRTLPAD